MGETVMRRKGLYRSVAFLAIAGLIAGACGGDDDSAPADTPSEEAEAPADEPAEEPAVEAGDEAEGDVDTAIEEEEAALAVAATELAEAASLPMTEARQPDWWKEALEVLKYAMRR